MGQLWKPRTAILRVNTNKDCGTAGAVREKLESLGIAVVERNADFAVVIGGDGTILDCARALDLPILGINLGRVGFIAELEPCETDLLSLVAEGQFSIERRGMLSLRVGGWEDVALNDAVIKGGARIVNLAVSAENDPLIEFTGDGLVIATPTGSTAYSMSAGGPILDPATRSIAVTPICPQGVRARPFVLSDERVVTVKALSDAVLSADGREEVAVGRGQTVTVSKSARETRLIRVRNRNFYQMIYDKLGRI